jgi:DnaJ family protein C protein 19
MLTRLLLLCALIAVLVFIVRHFSHQSPQQRKNTQWQIVLGVIALMLILLAATGRIHWIGAIFATLLAFFRQLTPLLIRWFPTLKHLYQQYTYQRRHQHDQSQPNNQQQQRSNHSQTSANKSQMERSAAFKILGLREGASRDEIIQAHRKLMQKVHPDRGGSDELAAQVNRAKDVLLNH